MSITTFTPPTDCTTVNLGTVAQDDCFPTQKLSEFTHMFLGRKDAIDFTDASDATEWADRLSQSTTVPTGSTVAVKDLIRKIAIIGDMPAPAEQEKDISGGRKHAPYKDFTINFEIDDIGPEEYEFFRNCQYGIQYVKAWVKSRGSELLGGNKGLNGGSEVRIKAWPIYGKGPDEIVKIIGTLTWKGQVAPDRCVSPI
jgi:hypothetical protein